MGMNPDKDGAARSRGLRVGFLFNHEGHHHIAHSAPIAAALSRLSVVDVSLLFTTREAAARARVILGVSAIDCRFVVLDPDVLTRRLQILDSVGPFTRVMNLIHHRNVLAHFDAVVSPERTVLLVRTLLRHRCPKLIHVKHGNGDRSQTVGRALARFDLVLLPGQKLADRLSTLGRLVPGQGVVVGYPKFDAIAAKPKPRLFNNDKPVVLFNPHPHAYLSSWYAMGRDVLEFFYSSPDYNLIFAPHVMLFRKRVHVSFRPFRVRFRKSLPEKYFRCPHILIDLESPALTDMTYTAAADIYVGDVSSQVYEFLKDPRPCVFLNSHRAHWENNTDYLAWRLGPVVSDVAELDRALRKAVDKHPLYRPLQEQAFQYSFARDDRSASEHAAEAILAYLHQSPVQGSR